MTWTVTKEDGGPKSAAEGAVGNILSQTKRDVPACLHVRAIIDLDGEQAELQELIASLQKHVKADG